MREEASGDAGALVPVALALALALVVLALVALAPGVARPLWRYFLL
jgi:hypothetical protein